MFKFHRLQTDFKQSATEGSTASSSISELNQIQQSLARMSQPDKTKKGKSKAVKFPCGTCNNTTSGSAAVACNICEYWHHTQCIPGMTDEFYKTMLTMKDSMGYSFFLCPKCEKVNKKVWQTVTCLTKRVDSMEKQIADLMDQLKSSNDNATQAMKTVQSVQKQTAVSSEQVKTTVLTEIQEQEKRKTNLVIYNLKESSSESSSDRKEHDSDSIKEVLSTIEVSDLHEDGIQSIRRLGPLTDPTKESTKPLKPRPLLLSFRSSSDRTKVLSSAKKLAGTSLKHISICPDLTKNQQKEDRELRDEVKQLNLDEPSDDKGAFLWKVVGTPGQPNRRKIKKYLEDPNQDR